MTNYSEMIRDISITLVILVISLSVFIGIASAKGYSSDVYDLWNTIEEFEAVSSLRKLIVNENWACEDISLSDLDYILVLTQQCSKEFFPNVPTSLALAVISMESSFHSDLEGFSNDSGLMQIIPNYHRERIEKYMYDEKVDIFDPRLNIMVGMDYLDELLAWSNGNRQLAVMAYNIGPGKAYLLYNEGWRSGYSEEVLRRADILEDFFERRG